MNTALLSIIVLIVAVLVGFFRKMNVGLVAILAVTIFATFIGIKDGDVIKGFSSSLFIMLLGVSFLCAIGISNGALELMSKKMLQFSGGHAIVAPIMIYSIGFIIAAIGPGAVPALGIVAALAFPLGKTTGYNPIMLGIIGEMGTFAGRFSPITPESVLIKGLANAQGIFDFEKTVLIYATITTLFLSLLAYLWYTKGNLPKVAKEKEAIPAFDKMQILTLLGFLVLIIGSAFFKRNVGLLAFAVGIALILFGAADEKKVFKTVSWSTLLMVTGFGMLMNIVISVGGVDLLSNALASIMSTRTAIAIQGLTGGIMSWFSSAIGVVWPTLIPTVGNIATNVGVSPTGLISILCLTASFAGLSPASTGGGLIMAAASSDPDFDKEKENKLFVELFVVSAVALLLIVLAALIGLYSIL